MDTLPTATPRHSTFFSWNLMDALISETCRQIGNQHPNTSLFHATQNSRQAHMLTNTQPAQTLFSLSATVHTLASRFSLCETSVGNLPALFRPGPSRRGICLITDSDARKAAYFFAATGKIHVTSERFHRQALSKTALKHERQKSDCHLSAKSG